MKKRAFLGWCLALGILVFSNRVSALGSDNLLTNAGFQSDLSSWSVSSNVVWSSRDVSGSGSSGSAFITDSFTDGTGPGLNQCVVLPNSGPFDVGGRFFFPSGQGQVPSGLLIVFWYSSTNCGAGGLDQDSFETPAPTPTDSWSLVSGFRIMPPAAAHSAAIIFAVDKPFGGNTGPTVDGYVDGTFFRLTSCTPADQDLCLNGGRFRVTAQWESATNGGVGHGVQFNDDSGYFWFFNADNTEVVVKVSQRMRESIQSLLGLRGWPHQRARDVERRRHRGWH